ncbi:hypothetical protein F5884DRAFT_418058 [Xylogone sp. PMI_703]|nr:hypothetical protein F5884DRAFT_418058 [Xylogone sp. PMI_703]
MDGSGASFSKNVNARDLTCRVTAWGSGTQSVSLIPKQEKEWFHSNDMNRYCSHRANVNHPSNGLLLRADICIEFDAGSFVIVPKCDNGEDGIKTRLTLHVTDGSLGFAHLLHNRPLQPLSGIRIEFLFARLAWTVFLGLNSG